VFRLPFVSLDGGATVTKPPYTRPSDMAFAHFHRPTSDRLTGFGNDTPQSLDDVPWYAYLAVPLPYASDSVCASRGNVSLQYTDRGDRSSPSTTAVAALAPSRTLQNTRTSDGVSSLPISVTAPSRHDDGCVYSGGMKKTQRIRKETKKKKKQNKTQKTSAVITRDVYERDR
jgi:hypothetical protein